MVDFHKSESEEKKKDQPKRNYVLFY